MHSDLAAGCHASMRLTKHENKALAQGCQRISQRRGFALDILSVQALGVDFSADVFANVCDQ